MKISHKDVRGCNEMSINTVEIKHDLTNKLINKLNTKTAVIGVVGLGYVGLPLAVENAKAGYQVIGFDVDPEKVEKLNQGVNYIGDVDDEELSQLVQTK